MKNLSIFSRKLERVVSFISNGNRLVLVADETGASSLSVGWTDQGWNNQTWLDKGWNNYSGSWKDQGWNNNSGSWSDKGWNNTDSWSDQGWNNW